MQEALDLHNTTRGASATLSMHVHAFVVSLLLVMCFVAETIASADGRELYAVANALSAADNTTPSADSLCGEQIGKETGFLNGLYYIYFESSRRHDPHEPPVILWLSGGPGCSGLVGTLFELGPCIFDDETDRISFNPHAWTALAHVIFLDQPRGTGFSAPDSDQSWSHQESTRDMTLFLVQFFATHSELAPLDFYIFGESYSGHFVPDLAQHLLATDSARWGPVLKGVGIGNGLVSPQALIDTYVDFAATTTYATDLLGSNEGALRDMAALFASTIQRCEAASNSSPPVRRPLLRTNADTRDCDAATELYRSFMSLADSGVVATGRNVYDLRRVCHVHDRIGLCYRFSRLEAFVNQAPVLAYFGASTRTWKLCSASAMHTLRRVDFVEESESRVAYLLERGVRVLVYAGDADAVVSWKCQDAWTRRLVWSGQRAFSAAPADGFEVSGRRAGLVHTARGLSFVRVFEAGHVRWELLSWVVVELTCCRVFVCVVTLCWLVVSDCACRWFPVINHTWRSRWYGASSHATPQRTAAAASRRRARVNANATGPRN